MSDQKISQLSSYTPPIDTDVMPIVDISTTVTKKITWANIKAALKTYFDSLSTTLINKTLTSPIINSATITGTITGISAGDNILLNPSFLVGATANLPLYWDLLLTPTLALVADTLFPALGGNQLTITGTAAAFEGIIITGSTTNWLKVKPSTTYTFSIDYSATAGDNLYVSVRSYNNASAGTAHVSAGTLNSTTAVRYTVTFTTDADATNIQIKLLANADGDIIIISHPKLEEGSIATPFEPSHARTRLTSKLIGISRDMAAASGDVVYTGLDFTPTSIIAFAGGVGTDLAIGASDSSLANCVINQDGAGNSIASTTALLTIGTAGTTQVATIKTYNANGLTLTWVKTGSPTGTVILIFLCFR